MRWWLSAAGLLVFNASSALAKPINSAAAAIKQHFDAIDSAIDDGDEIADAVRGKRIRAVMHRVISHARTQGFLTAAKHTKKPMPVMYGRKVLRAAEKRSANVNKLMKRSTKRILHNTPDSDYVLSKDRAVAAARFEAARSYFRGVRDGFQGSGFVKSWITSEGESCDNCQENEEAGPIGVDESFPSGDDYPLAHLNCGCMVGMHRI